MCVQIRYSMLQSVATSYSNYTFSRNWLRPQLSKISVWNMINKIHENAAQCKLCQPKAAHHASHITTSLLVIWRSKPPAESVLPPINRPSTTTCVTKKVRSKTDYFLQRVRVRWHLSWRSVDRRLLHDWRIYMMIMELS